ncbi:hypothetical protein RDWZM_008791, partial [Blomia tropicalis]
MNLRKSSRFGSSTLNDNAQKNECKVNHKLAMNNFACMWVDIRWVGNDAKRLILS